MLRLCPMLENLKKIRAMVEKSGAHSTDLQSPETADHLCSKCDQYAKNCQSVADKLRKENRVKREHYSISFTMEKTSIFIKKDCKKIKV